MRLRLGLAGSAAAATAAVLLFGGALRAGDDVRAEAPAASAPAAAAARLEDGFAGGDTASLVAQLEGRAADTTSLTLLGLAYQQRARETGDPDFYGPAERALERALRLDPDHAPAVRALASLAATRHRFDEALALARRARRLEPHNAAAYGIIGDASLELGRYDEAFAAFERQMELKPTVSAYARVSYARELLGDLPGAIAAMEFAVDAAASTREPAAWSRVQLGNLHVSAQRFDRATQLYHEALGLVPEYAPANAALAALAVARGDGDRAATLYRRALAVAPDPGAAAALGDLLAAAGDGDGAQRAWERAEELEAAFARNGGRNQLETALFDLDHDRNLADALARAREGYRLRPSIEGAHVLARALYKNGRCAEALRYSREALRLGTPDVGALFDLARIQRCLGKHAAAERTLARVHALDPHGLDLPPDA
ncbi:MAG TPA: tetratricopeptide repeat protein [Gaiellaceae bacterium]|nr:tetratricopeptide repeat protein [Gaiellaceae bacterium]